MWRAPTATTVSSSHHPQRAFPSSYVSQTYMTPELPSSYSSNLLPKPVTPLPPPLNSNASSFHTTRSQYSHARPLPAASYPYSSYSSQYTHTHHHNDADYVMVNRETLEDFECMLATERARAKYLEDMLALRQLSERPHWREEVEYSEYSPPTSPSRPLPPPLAMMPDPVDEPYFPGSPFHPGSPYHPVSPYQPASPAVPQVTQLYAQIQTPLGPQFIPVTLGVGEPLAPPMVVIPPPRSTPAPPSPYAIPPMDFSPRHTTISMTVSPPMPPSPPPTRPNADGVRILFDALSNSSGNLSADALLGLLRKQNAAYLPNIEGNIDYNRFDTLFRKQTPQQAESSKVKALLHELWKELDKDNSGFLDTQERIQLMQRFGIKTIIWRDNEADNKMDFEEFWGMIQNLPKEELDKVHSAASVLASQSWM